MTKPMVVSKIHKEYCSQLDLYTLTCTYDCGEIESVRIIFDKPESLICVSFRNGEYFEWRTEVIGSYNTQFGFAVSADGKYLFAQTWANGMYCLDPRSGKKIWRTKSKRGITSIFVNKDTVLCHQHERALQLLDMHTGEIISERSPATAWGFYSLDHEHIVCRVTARRWDIIDTETMETLESFTHSEFTAGHVDYCINDVRLT